MDLYMAGLWVGRQIYGSGLINFAQRYTCINNEQKRASKTARSFNNMRSAKPASKVSLGDRPVWVRGK